ncbi:hypothetical protein HCN44_005988 [Aphidius gifuensis]|uniref:Erythroid differentiation-related factor 1 n=1 Tax=Aphidius gifuensis TaxID=684658 RepID=A0A834Y625_APHGI|nr:erythroid differentiation-related factor 1 [Aphidius gifuensis]XP_044005805.1 erythroid differentiation-related factor 1 [Aphidius gifuensis]KAF7997417.1 hypothetical protein HCN44_005988 [Aphidius gifuensis]
MNQSDDYLSDNSKTMKPVKSTAVVKYSAIQKPATFTQLQCNTDLNHPPSNWLSSSADSYGLQSVWLQSTGFSSFRMAHMFPDCVGEVDVVSDAENIKKLLKIPYSQSAVSMMVHRIENTILIDDFDIQKYLLRQAESDWEWLKKFFYEHIIHNNDDKQKKRLFYKPANTRDLLQQKNLVSKFLYHSLVQNLSDNEKEEIKIDNDKTKNCELDLKNKCLEPVLPEPNLEDNLPDPTKSRNFARNVVWTFENIQMLIGTDMPIFGGQTHPCISLKLRDMNKPINVLTGIDYWLDNLMCNVPEVIMCYHLDGIVQKYELIKTEDLPNLNNANFSPKVIRDVAQNILSFLKNNATKAGHTYWLFKGKDDDVVKLYDLTSLCSDTSDDKEQNPFTVPVAMLLYRVARNMKYSSDGSQGHLGTIRILLKNCIQLLNREKYPQIVTSAHYMLSDLYIPADTDPAKPIVVEKQKQQQQQQQKEDDICQQNENAEYEFDDINNCMENEGKASATIKSLTLAYLKETTERNDFKYIRPPPVSGSIPERCHEALEHVVNGLECLSYFPIINIEEGNYNNNKYKEEKQNTAKPFEAIPMPYYTLNNNKNSSNNNKQQTPTKTSKKQQKKKLNKKNNDELSVVDTSPKALLCKPKGEALPTWQAPKKSDNLSWKSHLKTLLYEKASLIFAVLAEYEYTKQKFGSSLKYILKVLKCQKILEIFCGLKNDKLISYSLGRAGDCCLMIVQDWKNIDNHQKLFTTSDEVEDKIIIEILTIEKDDLDMNGAELLDRALISIEESLIVAYKCYEKALSLEPADIDKKNLLRRLGNVHNELGVLYMNQASLKYQQETNNDDDDNDKNKIDNNEDNKNVNSLLTKSLKHLEYGVKAFESVEDEANLALLHSNTGRLMRLCAHINVNKQTEERHFYNKALHSYQKALQILGNRKTNSSIWDTVNWDLSTTLFTMATLLQDYPIPGNKTEDELEKEVVEIFQKALKHCDTENPGPRQPVYQFRAATIQHRLASLYHRVYRELDTDTDNIKRKTSLQLCKLYYEKASKLMFSLEQPIEYLTIQLERVALAEQQAQTTGLFTSKLKSYQNGLDLIIQCQEILEIILEKNKINKNHDKKDDDTQKDIDIDNETEKLILLMEQRLQFLLRSLTKLCLGKNSIPNKKKEYENLAEVYKKCYSRSLRTPGSQTNSSLLEHMIHLIKDINLQLQNYQESV